MGHPALAISNNESGLKQAYGSLGALAQLVERDLDGVGKFTSLMLSGESDHAVALFREGASHFQQHDQAIGMKLP